MTYKEEWKKVEGYEFYEVSNLGNVRSLDKPVNSYQGIKVKKGKILSLKTDKNGYKIATLVEKNKHKSHRVHRLVANAFIPNPDNLPQVNHKDENKANNCVENLEWCANSYNINYGNRNKIVSEKRKIWWKNNGVRKI